MRISIITPSYNQVTFLEQTIKSVISQNYKQKEYIIIDGKSVDGSIDIIRKYEEHLTYWVSETDSGQSEAINKGFEIATGDIICWLNSDDLFLPGALSIVAEFFNKNPDIDCVFGHTIVIDQNNKSILRRHEIPFDNNIVLYSMNYIPQSSTFWRRSVYEKIGGLRNDLHFTMDHEYWLRMFKYNVKFGFIDKHLSAYRWQAESKGNINSKKIKKEKYTLLIEYSGINKKILFICAPVLKIIYKLKRQIIKVIFYGKFEIIPAHYIRWYYKYVKKHF